MRAHCHTLCNTHRILTGRGGTGHYRLALVSTERNCHPLPPAGIRRYVEGRNPNLESVMSTKEHLNRSRGSRHAKHWQRVYAEKFPGRLRKWDAKKIYESKGPEAAEKFARRWHLAKNTIRRW